MITVQSDPKVISSNISKESKFSIQASAKAFNILSSGLYSHKFEAIVRELSTNASDAHAAAGKKDIPIKVLGPTLFNPIFSVEDSGDGIPPEEFEEIYTTYFHSTKTNTNEQVGCFGLGSKSPFAYTSQFNVENCYGGKKYTYSCFKDANGQPSVAMLSEVPTDKSGVKVFFAVKSVDFSSFNNAISDILAWFDVTPETNVSITKFARNDEVFSLPTFNHRSDFFVRMGQVVYPISNQYVENVFRTGYRNSSLIINIPIGSIDITPSRESIEYTERTKSYLRTRSAVLLDHCQDLLKTIEDDNTLTKLEKFRAKKKLAGELQLQPHVFSKLDIHDIFCSFDSLKAPFDVYTKGQKIPHRINTGNFITQVRDEHAIFFFDRKKGNLKRLGEFFNSLPHRGWMVFVFDPEAKPELLKLGFEEKDFNYSSKITVFSQAKEKANCCELVTNSYYGNFSKVGYFLDPSINDGIYIKESQVKLLHLNIGKFNICVKEKVYVFTDRQYELLKIEKKNFVHLFDFFKKSVQDFPVETLRAFHVSKHNELLHNAILKLSNLTDSKVLSEYVKNFPTSTLKPEDLATISFLLKGMQSLDFNEYEKAYENLIGVTDLYNSCIESINKKYPLLKHLIDKTNFDGIIDDVVVYINLIGE